MTHEINISPKFEVGESVAFFKYSYYSERKFLTYEKIKSIGKDKIIMESGKTWSKKNNNYYGQGKQALYLSYKTSLISKEYADQIAVEIRKANEQYRILVAYQTLGELLRDAKSVEAARKILQEFEEPNEV